MNRSLLSSDRMDWRTPPELFRRLNEIYRFTLDPCATDRRVALCKKFFTPETDGLKQDWGGERAFVNPPYGRELPKWIVKAADYDSVCLIPARPDTKIWQELIFPEARAVCFVAGRIQFVGAPASAPFPSAIVVFGFLDADVAELADFGWTI